MISVLQKVAETWPRGDIATLLHRQDREIADLRAALAPFVTTEVPDPMPGDCEFEKWVKAKDVRRAAHLLARLSRDMAQPGMNTGPEQSGVVASGPSGAGDAGSTPAVATPSGEWECFCDSAYYNLWCVRRRTEREFGRGFHLHNKDEALALTKLLNRAPDVEGTPEPRGTMPVSWERPIHGDPS